MKRYLGTMFLSVIVFAIALALTTIEEWMKQHAIPGWQTSITHYVAITCFVVDAVAIVAAATLVTVRFVLLFVSIIRGMPGASKKKQ
jgi:hypothetical protein